MANFDFGNRHFVTGIDPVADAFSATVTTDIVELREYQVARFIVWKGVGATGTSTITVEACDDDAGTNATAIPFAYQAYISTTTDLPGAVTRATAAGFATTAGSSQLYVIEVNSQSLGSQGWVRLKAVEVVDSPVLGGVLIELLSPRYGTDIPASAIV